jgi:hypothetical protein
MAQGSSALTSSQQLYNAANGFVQMPTACTSTTSGDTTGRSFIQRRAPGSDVDSGFKKMKSCLFAGTH